VTRAGLLMGKVAYMPPEQVRGDVVTRGADIYSCGVVLWELLAGRRLHTERTQAQILAAVLTGAPPPLMESLEPMRESMTKERWDLLQRLEPIVSRATALRSEDRYASAAEMLRALVRVLPAVSALEVADWVKSRGSEYLERRQQVLARIEESWRSVSKIAVTSSSMGGPESGVQRVREPSVVTATRASALKAASAMYIPTGAEEPEIEIVPTADRRLVPWVVAGVSLLVSAVLVGALFAARPAPVAAAPAVAPPEPAAVVVAPPPAAAPEPTAPATSFLAPPMIGPKTAHAPGGAVATPLRKPAVDLFATPLHIAPAAAIPTAALPPKTDCDPPFYFEGTKKIFKPSCI
jgi:eukaryotic-like serine/threonine-protein kinase